MSQQGLTIIGIGKGRSSLQVLKLPLLRDNRTTNQKIVHDELSYTGKNKLVTFEGRYVSNRLPIGRAGNTSKLQRLTGSVRHRLRLGKSAGSRNQLRRLPVNRDLWSTEPNIRLTSCEE